MSNYITTGNDELYHYGVIGMRWGVRRGRTDRAYTKASKKLTRLNDKVDEYSEKAAKKSAIADKKIRSRFASEKSINKAVSNARLSQKDLGKRIQRANNWYMSMEKTFQNTSITMSKEQIALGRKYKDQLDTRAMLKYMTPGY